MSPNPIHGKVYLIQHYVIKFVSDLRHVVSFLQGIPVSSTDKTDCHDITEILLKVLLNTINQTKPHLNSYFLASLLTWFYTFWLTNVLSIFNVLTIKSFKRISGSDPTDFRKPIAISSLSILLHRSGKVFWSLCSSIWIWLNTTGLSLSFKQKKKLVYFIILPNSIKSIVSEGHMVD